MKKFSDKEKSGNKIPATGKDKPENESLDQMGLF